MSSLCDPAPGEPMFQVAPDKYDEPGATHNLSRADLMSINNAVAVDTVEVGQRAEADDVKPAIPRKRPNPNVLEDIADSPTAKGPRRRAGDANQSNTKRQEKAQDDRATRTSTRRTSSSYSAASAASSAGTRPSETSQESARGRHKSSDPADARSAKAGSVEAELDGDKLALRRARNRVAAYKSRAKKSKEISHLEEDMQRARDRKAELSSYAEELKSEVFMLKNEILMHGQCDFPPIKQYLMSSVMKLGPSMMQPRMLPPMMPTNLPPLPPSRTTMERPI